MRHLAIAAFPAVLVCALTACSDGPSPAEPASTAPSTAAMAQGRPTEVDETPFDVTFCGFPVEVVFRGTLKIAAKLVASACTRSWLCRS